MIRHAAVVAIVLLLSPSSLYAQSAAFTVKSASAEIHKGPSTSSPVVGTARRGAVLEVTREVGDWVKVSWPEAEDGSGYVYMGVGSLAHGSTPVMTAAAATTPAPSTAPTEAPAIESAPAAAAPSTVYVSAPAHTIGLGGLMTGSTLGFGATGRIWSRSRVGVQVAVSRISMTNTASPNRMTSTEFAPSVLFSLRDRVSDDVWVRPYIGGGANFYSSSLSAATTIPGESVTENTIGFQGFGGAEVTLPGAPRFAVSLDLGYRWSDAPFVGYDVNGLAFTLSGHWYFK
jgi:opacity protein-like surface antigen